MGGSCLEEVRPWTRRNLEYSHLMRTHYHESFTSTDTLPSAIPYLCATPTPVVFNCFALPIDSTAARFTSCHIGSHTTSMSMVNVYRPDCDAHIEPYMGTKKKQPQQQVKKNTNPSNPPVAVPPRSYAMTDDSASLKTRILCKPHPLVRSCQYTFQPYQRTHRQSTRTPILTLTVSTCLPPAPVQCKAAQLQDRRAHRVPLPNKRGVEVAVQEQCLPDLEDAHSRFIIGLRRMRGRYSTRYSGGDGCCEWEEGYNGYAEWHREARGVLQKANVIQEIKVLPRSLWSNRRLWRSCGRASTRLKSLTRVKRSMRPLESASRRLK